MKVFLFILLLVLSIATSNPSLADSDKSSLTANKGYLQRDPVFKNRTNIYDRSGRRKGYVQQDVLFKDARNIYDRSGRKIGRVKQDPLFSDTQIIYDRSGRKRGYVRQDPVFKDTKVIYDRNGRKEGYLKQDSLFVRIPTDCAAPFRLIPPPCSDPIRHLISKHSATPEERCFSDAG
jgi:uncharacterized protein YxjI